MATSLKIRIGASVDSSVASSFASVEKQAQRAGASIKKSMVDATRAAAHAASGAAGPYRQTGLAATEAGKRAKDAGAVMGGSVKQVAGDFKALRGLLQKMPADFKTIEREAQKALQAIARENARAALGLSKAPPTPKPERHSRFWSTAGGRFFIQKPHMDTLSVDRVTSGVASYGMGALGFARHAAMGVAHAAGIETDFSRLAERNVTEESEAQKLVNAGYIPGQSGPNGTLRDKGEILSRTRTTAGATGTERGELIEGLRGFVGKTGDLQLALDTMDGLARLSRATGSNFADMSEAAAEVANHLGDVPDKARVTETIMRQIAGQGKLGAVEIRDLAAQMAKIAATANQFKGGAAANIATLGVFAQESKLEGGSTGSAQAATAVARFASGLTSERSLKHWQAHGFANGVFTDKTRSELQDPLTIVKMALQAASGQGGKGKASKTVLQELFPNVMAYRAVAGWESVYNRAGGGNAGMQAVEAEFQRLSSAQLTEEEVTRAFTASMQTAEAKSKQFNEAIASVAEQLEGSLLPVVMELAPLFLQLATGLAEMAKRAADWFTEGKTTRDSADSSQRTGDNARSLVRRWEEANLIQNGEVPVDAEQNLKDAAKPLGILDSEIQKSQAQLDPLAKKVRDEGKSFSTLPVSEWGEAEWHWTKSKAAGGDNDAMRFLADYGSMNRLHATLDNLKDERSNLVTLLKSGSVTVRVAQDAPPAASGKGALPANSRSPVSPPAHP